MLGLVQSLLGKRGGKLAMASAEESDARFWSPVSSWFAPSKAGVNVDPESAMALSAYYACIKVLGEDVAKLPLPVFRAVGVDYGEIDRDHPVYPLLKLQPNPEMIAFTFREMLTNWAAGWGNGYAEIVRDEIGTPRQLWPIHPSRVEVKRIEGQLTYRVRVGMGGQVLDFMPGNMLHIRGPGSELVGRSVASVGAESLGLALAQQQYAGGFYGNGTSIGGILKFPNKLDAAARVNLRESWQARHGGPGNAHRTAILEEGGEFLPTTVNPRDAQFLEGQQFSVETVCRWFRVSPHKVQHLLRATFSNIEHQNIDHVVDTLMPWCVRWEQEIQVKLLGLDERHYAKHMMQAQMRGDNAARGQFYSQLFQLGAINADEIRAFEDMPPTGSPGGKTYFVQGALVPARNQLLPAPTP